MFCEPGAVGCICLWTEVYAARIDRVATVVAIVLFIGYASIPTAVLLGLVK